MSQIGIREGEYLVQARCTPLEESTDSPSVECMIAACTGTIMYTADGQIPPFLAPLSPCLISSPACYIIFFSGGQSVTRK
jgi:hypothetical protein